MADVATRRAPETAQQYIARLLAALGDRDPFEVMAQTVSAIRQLTAGLDAAGLNTPEGPGLWSVRQVIQHLSDSELVGAFRLRMVLAHDRPALAGYDQEAWAARLHYEQADVEEALIDFERLRNSNLRLLEQTSVAERQRVGLHSERGEESIEDMIVNYAGHDIVHLQQIARIREAISRNSA